MPSVFTHPIPTIALAAGLGKNIIPPRLAAVTVIASILPDLDVAGFAFGVRYAETLGHRGLSHSLVFALAVASLAFLAAPLLHSRRVAAFLAVLFAIVSHIALDAATTGGLGVAFLWPFEDSRYFFPWRPIAVSPFSPKAFMSARGLRVILSELRWVWLPCFGFAITFFLLRKVKQVTTPYRGYPAKHSGGLVRQGQFSRISQEK